MTYHKDAACGAIAVMELSKILPRGVRSPKLYHETVRRTFTAGLLKGCTINQTIRFVTKPRDIGTVQEVDPGDGRSPYRDEVTGWMSAGEAGV